MKALSDKIKVALSIASKMHRGQVDKAGADYILHPVTVALTLADNGCGENAIVAGLLHDVVEDTDMSFDDLLAHGIDPEVVEALRLLTHDKGVDYLDYVKTLRSNPIARAVKCADLMHNSDLSRLPQISADDLKRVEKYRQALALLTE